MDANGKLIRRGDTLTNRYGWKMTIVDIGFTCCVVERVGRRFKIDKESICGGGWAQWVDDWETEPKSTKST